MLSQELIQELQLILKKDYGHDIEIKEADEIGQNLVSYFEVLTEIYRDNQDKLNINNKITNENEKKSPLDKIETF